MSIRINQEITNSNITIEAMDECKGFLKTDITFKTLFITGYEILYFDKTTKESVYMIIHDIVDFKDTVRDLLANENIMLKRVSDI